MADVLEIRVSFLEESIKKLEDKITRLEQERDTISIAVAALAEMIRRIDFEMTTGESAEHKRLGSQSLFVNSNDGHNLPIRIVTTVQGTCVRVDFFEDGVDAVKHN